MIGEREFRCHVDGLVPHPPARVLPPRKPLRKREAGLLIGWFLAFFDLAEFIVEWVWRGLVRLAKLLWRPVRGQVWSGGWKSEAGRFLVEVRWGRDRLVLEPGAGGVGVRVEEYEPGVRELSQRCVLRRLRGRRVELGFGDGSWVTVWLRSTPAGRRFQAQSEESAPSG